MNKKDIVKGGYYQCDRTFVYYIERIDRESDTADNDTDIAHCRVYNTYGERVVHQLHTLDHLASFLVKRVQPKTKGKVK